MINFYLLGLIVFFIYFLYAFCMATKVESFKKFFKPLLIINLIIIGFFTTSLLLAKWGVLDDSPFSFRREAAFGMFNLLALFNVGRSIYYLIKYKPRRLVELLICLVFITLSVGYFVFVYKFIGLPDFPSFLLFLAASLFFIPFYFLTMGGV